MSVLTFGPFRLDEGTLELWRGGLPVPIRPKACRLLTLLASRPGELITRDEIAAALWPDVHVRVDAGLNSCLKQIRTALNDGCSKPRWIETLSRRGYRFLGKVRRYERAADAGIRRLVVLPVRPVAPTDDRVLPLLPALGDEIAGELSRLGGSLLIIPPSCVGEGHDHRPSLRVLADAGVDFALDCRVYCAGPVFRVAAQLVDVGEPSLAWARVFDGSIDDRFATQRTVARSVVAAVHAVLGLERPTRLAG